MVSLSNHEHRETLAAALAYLLLTLVFTWPLARGLTRDVPGDFGDPLLNAWILAWDATHLGRGLWNANIYYPHPLALAYSEHLLPQAISILPVYWAAPNPILAYNLALLSTFALSGLGMFLLVRELTGNRAAAFVAGVAYAFAPYRVTSIPHLQILSSQWLPFALYGLRRFFAGLKSCATTDPASFQSWRSASAGPLWLGAAAWVLQNLSCGYYLLFFSPVMLAYLLWEMTIRNLWREKQVVATIATACVVVFAVTLVITWPYFQLRALGFSPRSLDETTKFSADTWALFTADPNLRVWGSIVQGWPKAEGALFPGFTIVVLGACGAVARSCVAQAFRPAFGIAGLKRCATFYGLLASLALLAALSLGWSLRLPVLKITSFSRALIVVGAIWTIALAASRETRRTVAQWLATPAAFFTLVAIFAIVMSWGPSIHARGRIVASSNVYALFYSFVPGFDGVRVPARFGMILTLALSVLAGLGVAALTRTRGAIAVAALSAAALFVEGLAVPIPINQNAVDYVQPRLAPLPGSVAEVPPVYAAIAKLPPGTPIVELPLGEPAFDVRYMLFSTTHWQPLVNGYSGGAPADYHRLDQTVQDAVTRPEPAWEALMATGATHAVVHEASYADDRGALVSAWLVAYGAQELAAVGSDRIFRIR